METRYIIFDNPDNNIDENQGVDVSKEIYYLLRPPGERDLTNEFRYFGTISHPIENKIALIIEPDRIIKVNPNNNLENLFGKINQNPNIPQNVKDIIYSKLNPDRTMKVGDMFPSSIKRYTYVEMSGLGWFGDI